jgi:hypothetical protein
MITSYLKVAEHIRDELISLEKTYQRIHRANQSLLADIPNSDLFADAIALSLHDFYNGIERIFTKIATTVDGNLPTGKNWHQKLIQQMLTDNPDFRPSVISESLLSELDELRRFHHVVRSLYAFELDQNRIVDLIQKLDILWEPLKQELRDFAELLEAIALNQ